jgi:hypothetical protein
MPVIRIYRCCMNFDQDFIVLGSGFFYFFELKNFRWSVAFICNCFHEYSSTNSLIRLSSDYLR